MRSISVGPVDHFHPPKSEKRWTLDSSFRGFPKVDVRSYLDICLGDGWVSLGRRHFQLSLHICAVTEELIQFWASNKVIQVSMKPAAFSEGPIGEASPPLDLQRFFLFDLKRQGFSRWFQLEFLLLRNWASTVLFFSVGIKSIFLFLSVLTGWSMQVLVWLSGDW